MKEKFVSLIQWLIKGTAHNIHFFQTALVMLYIILCNSIERCFPAIILWYTKYR